MKLFKARAQFHPDSISIGILVLSQRTHATDAVALALIYRRFGIPLDRLSRSPEGFICTHSEVISITFEFDFMCHTSLLLPEICID